MMSNHDSNDIHSESMPEHITPDVYERLRDRLDHMAKGFPAANGGEELKVLRQLFTPEDAVTFLAMRDADESPADVAARMGGDIAGVMWQRGWKTWQSAVFSSGFVMRKGYYTVPCPLLWAFMNFKSAGLTFHWQKALRSITQLP